MGTLSAQFSYSLIAILLKLFRCCDHALKICMWLGYNPQNNFCHFFRNLNFAIFGIFTMKVNGQWVPCVRNSFYSFIPILLKLYRCCDHAMKICMWFGYNLFLSLLSKIELSHFSGILTMKVNEQWVPCVRNFSYSFMPIHLKLYMCYGHGLKICMWFGYNPWIIFCHFFHNLNLVIFSGI